MTITKTTEQLNHEIKEAGNIQDFLVSNQNNILTTSLSEHLRTLLFEKNLQKRILFIILFWTGYMFIRYLQEGNSLPVIS